MNLRAVFINTGFTLVFNSVFYLHCWHEYDSVVYQGRSVCIVLMIELDILCYVQLTS